MLNNTKALIEREVLTNYKNLTLRLPLVIIVLAAYIFFPSYLENKINILIILGISINLLFAMIFFPQIYLRELKNNEIKFLFTFLVAKKKIIISKAIYILITILFFNLILMIPAFILFNRLTLFINVFIMNLIIGIVTGFVFLALFLDSSYEDFNNKIIIVFEIIIGIFFILVSIIKVNLWDINNTFYINPVYSFCFLIVLIFSSIKLLQITFKNI
jgi:hypothetical protein